MIIGGPVEGEGWLVILAVAGLVLVGLAALGGMVARGLSGSRWGFPIGVGAWAATAVVAVRVLGFPAGLAVLVGFGSSAAVGLAARGMRGDEGLGPAPLPGPEPGSAPGPHRYTELHEAAEALVDRLERDWRVRREVVVPDRTVRRAWPGSSAVRLRPLDGGAPLVVTRTTFPGLVLDFGFTGQLAIPECGCDECDESIEECRARLEEVTAAVVGGRLTEERIRRVARPDRYGWRLEFEHGSQSRVGLEILTERASRVAIPPGETRWPPWLPR